MKKMFKKLVAVMLAATLVISLAGCSSSDENSKKKQATDAFNDTATEFNKVATLINENAGVIDDDTISTFQEMSSVLSEYTELLSQDTVLDDAKYDEMIEWFASVKSWTKEAETSINDMINAANTMLPMAVYLLYFPTTRHMRLRISHGHAGSLTEDMRMELR